MSTKIKIGNTEVNVVKKNIKNLHLGVYPTEGRVRIAAPQEMNDESIRLFAISKIPWIRKQQSKFLKQEREAKREYLSGESHYFKGRRYLLDVQFTNEQPRAEIKKNIRLFVKEGSKTEIKEKIMEDLYRNELKKEVPVLVEKWEKLIGVKVNDYKIRKMKTKWGSCNPDTKRIWINLELAKKSSDCLEYIIVHEMVHLLEKKHSPMFEQHLDNFMPDWEQHKKELNSSLLGHAIWKTS